MLKRIGTLARHEMERLFGVKIYLDLHVRVQPGWRDKGRILKRTRLALQWPETTMLKLFAFSMALILLAASCLAADKTSQRRCDLRSGAHQALRRSDRQRREFHRGRQAGRRNPHRRGRGGAAEGSRGKLAKKVNGVKQVINNLTVAKGGK